MPDLTRRPDPHRAHSWLVYYGDFHVGTISKCVGNPGAGEAWQWLCGFYPGSNPCEQLGGTAGTFDQARARIEAAWHASICQSAPRPTFKPGAISVIGRRKNIAALIAASGCRRIGGLVNCDRHRDSWMAPRINLVGQRFGYLTVTKQVAPQLYPVAKTACAAAGAAV